MERLEQKFGTYDINLNISDYYGDDTIKLISLTINYPVSKNNVQKLEMQRIKTK